MHLLIWIRLKSVIFFLPFFLCMQGNSQPTYVLKDTSSLNQLDSHVLVFIDEQDTTDITTIVRPSFQPAFKSHDANLTFGYQPAPIWIKAKLKTSDLKTRWFLEIPAPFLEYVDFYQSTADNGWIHLMGGYYRPRRERSVVHTNHVFPLSFKADSIITVYIRITGQSPKTFPLYAIERQHLIEKTRFEDVGYGVFFGILIVMFFYNLFIYLTIRENNYLLYIGTIVCTFLVFSSASGYAGRFLWPEYPILNFYAGRMTLGLLGIFMAIFTIRFLSVKKYSPAMYYALIALIPLGIISSVLVGTGLLPSAGNNLITVSTILFMTTGVVCRINGNKTATYFIAAWSIYLTGGTLLTLRNSGVFDFNFWTTHFVEIGAALETMIIAFAIGDQFRSLRIEKEQAQILALKLQREATGKLEIKVKERTEELSRANAELHSTLETNGVQTRIIEDKNAELDAFFYRISHDLKGPISSMLGLSMLAKMEIKDEHALAYMDKQHSQIERLNHIITSLINLTQLNHADLQRQRIDFESMIDDCIDSLRGLSNFDELTFREIVQPGLEFYSEWALLNAIFQNLIENAIKYARRNDPYVQIKVFEEPPCLVIEVEDNGQGIPDEYQGRIFEMFFRATQNASGTGLGLYILKRSVDRLKGSVDFKSSIGAGSLFTVKLPMIKHPS
jgi:signal transduction histidine kinase